MQARAPYHSCHRHRGRLQPLPAGGARHLGDLRNPALVLAAVVAARPRVPRVLAGVTLLEAMIVGATYLVAFASAGDGP
jgi:hypothetical protein